MVRVSGDSVTSLVCPGFQVSKSNEMSLKRPGVVQKLRFILCQSRCCETKVALVGWLHCGCPRTPYSAWRDKYAFQNRATNVAPSLDRYTDGCKRKRIAALLIRISSSVCKTYLVGTLLGSFSKANAYLIWYQHLGSFCGVDTYNQA